MTPRTVPESDALSDALSVRFRALTDIAFRRRAWLPSASSDVANTVVIILGLAVVMFTERLLYRHQGTAAADRETLC